MPSSGKSSSESSKVLDTGPPRTMAGMPENFIIDNSAVEEYRCVFLELSVRSQQGHRLLQVDRESKFLLKELGSTSLRDLVQFALL